LRLQVSLTPDEVSRTARRPQSQYYLTRVAWQEEAAKVGKVHAQRLHLEEVVVLPVVLGLSAWAVMEGYTMARQDFPWRPGDERQ